MPSIILSDNGVSSGSAGLKSTAANDGALVLQTTTAGGTATTALTISNTQVVSLANPMSLANGSAAAPAITGTDTDTGIFFPAANTLAFSTNGTEDARFDPSGNFGLGVTPSAWFSTWRNIEIGGADSTFAGNGTGPVRLVRNAFINSSGTWIYKNTDFASHYQQSSGIHAWFTAPSGTAGNAISFTQAMTLDASGNLGIGTTSQNERLRLNSSTAGQARLSIAYADTPISYFGSYSGITGSGNATDVLLTSANVLAFGSGGTTERARIDSSGNLLVGTTSQLSSALLSVNGSSNGVTAKVSTNSNSVFVGQNSSGSVTFNVNGTGQINSVFTSINAISDQRFKTNISTIKYGLNSVVALNPVSYDFVKNDIVDGAKNNIGFIAQDVQKVIPELVSQSLNNADDGTPYLTLKMGDLIPVLVKAIQELKAIVDAQAAEIAALKGTQQ